MRNAFEVIKHVPASPKRVEYVRSREEYWDGAAREFDRWQPFRNYYRRQIARNYSFVIPPGLKVLEIGCGAGDLLAALKPSYGVGLDLSSEMVRRAAERHPHLTFLKADAQDFDLDQQFDVILCSDLINELWDVQTTFEGIARHCHSSTRLVLNVYSHLWQLPRLVAEKLGLAKPMKPQNWLTVGDTVNLLELAGFEVIRRSPEIMMPVKIPLVSNFANRYLVRLWPFRELGITNFLVARLKRPPDFKYEPTVSVIVAARNEAGNMPQIVDRLPQMGGGTELIIVEGHSKDETYEAAEREIAARPGFPARLYRQTGKGKGDAVRLGFEKAQGDLLMILDADLTVAPEDLPRFYEAWRSGKGDFINGVRLVYPMEDHAMRFFNLIGNKFFSVAFSWLFNQSIRDTLCGTKVLSRRDYEHIAANRSYFGDFDPFGDFDLLFGAARFNLRLVDIPVRYGERTYGDTNIQRWSHGMLLLRMVLLATRRLKFV